MIHRENGASASRMFFLVLSILLFVLGLIASIWALVGMLAWHSDTVFGYGTTIALYAFGGRALYAYWGDCSDRDSPERRRKKGFTFVWSSFLPFAFSVCVLLLSNRYYYGIWSVSIVAIATCAILGVCFLATGLSLIANSRGLSSQSAREGESDSNWDWVFMASRKIVLGIGIAAVVANVLLFMAVMVAFATLLH